ncbi:hypothetical protein [Kitasatospora sp. NPDC059571]|uniref:hypothetical protein n=1 Tax=Kitasatospora sp. NPDC059571 TaxID=3346871 RepID=UPI0036CCCC7F
MQTTIARLAEEAELQFRDGTWEPTPADRLLAAEAEADLAAAVAPPHVQEGLPPIDRLERLRTALAVLAVAITRVHGHLAWFLAAASTALAPVLHWRALPAEEGHSFGAVLPEPGQYADAEDAVRRLQQTLTRISAA